MAKQDIGKIIDELKDILGEDAFPLSEMDHKQAPEALLTLKDYFPDTALPSEKLSPEQAKWYLEYAEQSLPSDTFQNHKVDWKKFTQHFHGQHKDLTELAKLFEKHFSDTIPRNISYLFAKKIMRKLEYEFSPSLLFGPNAVELAPLEIWTALRNDAHDAFEGSTVDWDRFTRWLFRKMSELDIAANDKAFYVVPQLKKEFDNDICSEQGINEQLAREVQEFLTEKHFSEWLSNGELPWIMDGLNHCFSDGKMNWRKFTIVICREDERQRSLKRLLKLNAAPQLG